MPLAALLSWLVGGAEPLSATLLPYGSIETDAAHAGASSLATCCLCSCTAQLGSCAGVSEHFGVHFAGTEEAAEVCGWGFFSPPKGPSSNRARKSQIKSRLISQMTRKPNTQNITPIICLFDRPALKVRLAASSKRDGNELAWVMNAAPTAAAVWAEHKFEVADGAAQKFSWSYLGLLLLHWNAKSAPPLLRSSLRSLLYELALPFPKPGAPWGHAN